MIKHNFEIFEYKTGNIELVCYHDFKHKGERYRAQVAIQVKDKKEIETLKSDMIKKIDEQIKEFYETNNNGNTK